MGPRSRGLNVGVVLGLGVVRGLGMGVVRPGWVWSGNEYKHDQDWVGAVRGLGVGVVRELGMGVVRGLGLGRVTELHATGWFLWVHSQ